MAGSSSWKATKQERKSDIFPGADSAAPAPKPVLRHVSFRDLFVLSTQNS